MEDWPPEIAGDSFLHSQIGAVFARADAGRTGLQTVRRKNLDPQRTLAELAWDHTPNADCAGAGATPGRPEVSEPDHSPRERFGALITLEPQRCLRGRHIASQRYRRPAPSVVHEHGIAVDIRPRSMPPKVIPCEFGIHLYF